MSDVEGYGAWAGVPKGSGKGFGDERDYKGDLGAVTPASGAKKNDAADCKVRTDLFPPTALYGISTVFTYGAAKYDDWNWAKGLQYSRLYGALQRHLLSWYMGQDLDPETGFSHLWHAGCNIAMLIHTEMVYKTTANNKGLDDRPKTYHSINMQEQWLYILKNSESYKAVSGKQ